MTTPNLVNTSNIQAHSACINATTVSGNIIVNVPGTNSSIRLNTIILANYSGNIIQSNVVLNRLTGSYYLGGNISIPAYSTLVLMAKDTVLYIEENDYLQANASANVALTVTTSYEQIS